MIAVKSNQLMNEWVSGTPLGGVVIVEMLQRV